MLNESQKKFIINDFNEKTNNYAPSKLIRTYDTKILFSMEKNNRYFPKNNNNVATSNNYLPLITYFVMNDEKLRKKTYLEELNHRLQSIINIPFSPKLKAAITETIIFFEKINYIFEKIYFLKKSPSAEEKKIWEKFVLPVNNYLLKINWKRTERSEHPIVRLFQDMKEIISSMKNLYDPSESSMEFEYLAKFDYIRHEYGELATHVLHKMLPFLEQIDNQTQAKLVIDFFSDIEKNEKAELHQHNSSQAMRFRSFWYKKICQHKQKEINNETGNKADLICSEEYHSPISKQCL